MKSWGAGGQTPAQTSFSADATALVNDVQLINNEFALPEGKFKTWQRRVDALKKPARDDLCVELLVITERYRREAGAAATPIITQLIMLTAALAKSSSKSKR